MAIRKYEGGLTKTAFWLVGAKLIGFAVAFALPLFLVRHLDKHTFGVYKQLFLILSLCNGFLHLGFPFTAYYFFPRFPKSHIAIVGNIVAFVTCIGIATALVFALFPQLLVWLTNEPENSSYGVWMGLSIGFTVIAYFIETAPIVNQETWLATRVVLTASTSRALTLLFAGVVFGTIQALLIATVIQQGLQAVAMVVYLQSRFPHFWRHLDLTLFRQQFGYTVRLAIPTILLTLQDSMHQIGVSRLYGPGVFAVYSNGCVQIPLVGILTEAIGPLLIRQVSTLHTQNDSAGIIRLIMAAARKLAAVFFPLYALLAVTSREFILLLFTQRYEASIPYFLFSICTIPLAVILFDPVSRSYPQHFRTLLAIRLSSFAVMAGGLWLFTATFGPIGAIVTSLVVMILERGAMAIFWCRVLQARWGDLGYFRTLMRIALAAALAAAVTAIVRLWLTGQTPFWVLTICSTVFAFVYAGFGLLLRVPTEQELAIAKRILSRWVPAWRGT